MCSACSNYEGPYDEEPVEQGAQPHKFAGVLNVEHHIVTLGYADMDVEVQVFACSCGEQFSTEREFNDHVEDEKQ